MAKLTLNTQTAPSSPASGMMSCWFGSDGHLYTKDESGNVLDLSLVTVLDEASEKASPADADLIPLSDSADSYALKKLAFADLKAAFPQANAFDNADFQVWQRGTDDTSVTTTRKYVADRWAVATGAGTLSHVQRSSTVPSAASIYSLQLDGASGVTTVDIDQRLESISAGKLKTTVVFAAQIYNGSGSAFTPKLLVATPSATDNWTTSTVRNGGGSGEDLQECADSAWTQVTWTADISGYTDIDNGVSFKIQIPSGSLVAGDTVRVAEAQLEKGSTPSVYVGEDYRQALSKCQYYFIACGGDGASQIFGNGYTYGTTLGFLLVVFPNQMRAAPTLTISSASHFQLNTPSTSTTCSSVAINASNRYNAFLQCGTTGCSSNTPCIILANTLLARLYFDATL